MDRIANAVIVLWGWRRLALAFVAGAVSALALSPFDIFPVLWLTVPVFIWLLDGANGPEAASRLRRLMPAALVGWTFGFGYFLAGLWWVGSAFLVDADQFAWLLPMAVLLLPAGLALFFALGAAVARALWTDGWPRILVFAVCMAAAEWLRGHLLSGFPWNAFGYALTPSPVMMQSASVVGIWSLTLAAFIIFAAPAVLSGSRGQRGRERGSWIFIGVALGLLGLHAAFGFLRIPAAPTAIVPDVRLRIVQPALDQSEKWQVENEDAIVRRYLELSDGATSPDRAGVGSASLLIWPESAFPFLLTERPAVLSAIAELLPEGTTLITGAARAESMSGRDNPSRVFNSIYVISDQGEIIDAYDKVHLVPFGEFLPFRGLFEAIGMRQLIALPGGFAPGARRRTIEVAGAPAFGPLICYEIVFPGEVLDPDRRPGWLLNLTNDTWFGKTPGPYQHFLQARVRAVEEGLPLVRAANSGISAIVDPYGRIEKSLGLGAAGIVDGDLPAALGRTLYGRFGDLIFVAFMILTVAAIVAGALTYRLKRN